MVVSVAGCEAHITHTLCRDNAECAVLSVNGYRLAAVECFVVIDGPARLIALAVNAINLFADVAVLEVLLACCVLIHVRVSEGEEHVVAVR